MTYCQNTYLKKEEFTEQKKRKCLILPKDENSQVSLSLMS